MKMISAFKAHTNKYYEEIKQICVKQTTSIWLLLWRLCTIQRGWIILKKVNKIYPEIHNYENAVEGDQYFLVAHEWCGARLFMMRIKDFFKKITIYYFKKIRSITSSVLQLQNRYSKIKNWMKIVF
jgi:hypothetical protein